MKAGKRDSIIEHGFDSIGWRYSAQRGFLAAIQRALKP